MEFEAFERKFFGVVNFPLIFVWKGRPREKRGLKWLPRKEEGDFFSPDLREAIAPCFYIYSMNIIFLTSQAKVTFG
jgi:hypothetical protein